MKRILLAFLSVLAALTCPTALVAAQEAVSDDPAQAAYLDRASEASLSLDDVAPGWQADRHYTLFIEALGLVVSDAMFSFPDEQRINLFNTVFVGDPTPVDRAYALQWPDFTRRGARIADGPPVGTEWVWIGPMLDPTQPPPIPPTGQPFFSVDFG